MPSLAAQATTEPLSRSAVMAFAETAPPMATLLTRTASPSVVAVQGGAPPVEVVDVVPELVPVAVPVPVPPPPEVSVVVVPPVAALPPLPPPPLSSSLQATTSPRPKDINAARDKRRLMSSMVDESVPARVTSGIMAPAQGAADRRGRRSFARLAARRCARAFGLRSPHHGRSLDSRFRMLRPRRRWRRGPHGRPRRRNGRRDARHDR